MLSPQEELRSVSQILHLTHHRNKNQHRLAKWYKSFNLLRRHTSKLSTELDTNVQYTALSAKAKKTIESREIVESRVAFLQDVLVERCYLAFSQLVADNQYAALGLMLLGVLARVRRVTEPLRAARMDEKEAEQTRAENTEELDLGEVVKREELPVEDGGKERTPDNDMDDAQPRKPPKKKKRSMIEEAKGSSVEKPIATKRPKKKRKKGDAFDDLFAGLV